MVFRPGRPIHPLPGSVRPPRPWLATANRTCGCQHSECFSGSIPEKERAGQQAPRQLRGPKWSGPGSNRRHMDFQSIALPTELPDRWLRGENGKPFGGFVNSNPKLSESLFSAIRRVWGCFSLQSTKITYS